MKVEIKVNDKSICINLDDDNINIEQLQPQPPPQQIKTKKQKGSLFKCKCGASVLKDDWSVKRHYETAKHKFLMGL